MQKSKRDPPLVSQGSECIPLLSKLPGPQLVSNLVNGLMEEMQKNKGDSYKLSL